jgi:glutamyl/glutaminyl-tRNA synthetase
VDLAGQLPAVEWTRESLGAAMKAAAARHGLKPGAVMMAMRALVCGTRETPAIDAVLALLGTRHGDRATCEWIEWQRIKADKFCRIAISEACRPCPSTSS